MALDVLDGAGAAAGKRKLLRIRELLSLLPELEPAYRRARDVIRVFQKSAFYEITQRCNLLCEGCYYFEGGHDAGIGEEANTNTWQAFFGAEGARGVTMGYFVGAEPALEQERLLAANEYIHFGNIGTNGTIRIHPDVPYKVHISVWGGDATDALLRGGAVFRKALKNYEGDARAVAIYTFNGRNAAEVGGIARACRDHGIRMTFNLYSPTQTYLGKLSSRVPNDGKFFRISRPDDNLTLTQYHRDAIREACDALVDDFPETVLYTKAFNRFVTRPKALHDIDPISGIAEHCRSRIRGHLAYYTSDLKRADVKCCTPAVDCSECRLYSGGWAGRLEPDDADLATSESFQDWLEMVKMLSNIFVNEARVERVARQAGAM